MFQAMDLLLASRDTKTKKEFDQLQMSLGHNWNPHGLLADQDLRRHVLPISTLTYDPMHCILSNGIAHTELFLFLDRCKNQLGVKYSHMETFLAAAWTYPHIQHKM